MRFNENMERYKAFGELGVEIVRRIKEETKIQNEEIYYGYNEIPRWVCLYDYSRTLLSTQKILTKIITLSNNVHNWTFDISKIVISIYAHESSSRRSWFAITARIQSKNPVYYFYIKNILYKYMEEIDRFSSHWNKNVKIRIKVPTIGGEELRDGEEWNEFDKMTFYNVLYNNDVLYNKKELINIMKECLDWWDN